MKHFVLIKRVFSMFASVRNMHRKHNPKPYEKQKVYIDKNVINPKKIIASDYYEQLDKYLKNLKSEVGFLGEHENS